MIINGQKLAFKKQKALKKKLKSQIVKKNRYPLLISLVAKQDKQGLLYTKIKHKKARELNIKFKKYIFSLKEKDQIYVLLDNINDKEVFDGLIIQKPGQKIIKKYFKTKKEFQVWWLTATSQIPEKKDVDCLNVANLGLFSAGLVQFYPATVKAVWEIILTVFTKEQLKGKEIVIIGSSEILGKPLAMLLRNKGSTVTIVGSAVKDLKAETKKADILISCVGKPKLITADMVRKHALVIDVGIYKKKNKVIGDVDFKPVSKKVDYITPVPGGVGPMTVISLLENVYKVFKKETYNEKISSYAFK
jgi:methylenetetrahydrofolate dehydrogenase (NADP+) / methenyltetrahydrofolate cyclohydrolase